VACIPSADSNFLKGLDHNMATVTPGLSVGEGTHGHEH
jgi:hypothetical protein